MYLEKLSIPDPDGYRGFWWRNEITRISYRLHGYGYNRLMDSLSRRIAWNTVVQIAGKMASTTLGVAITFLLTHYLSHKEYGVYTFSLVFVTLFGTLADWGLTLITVREASKNTQEAHEIIGNVLVIRLVLALMAAAIAVLAINLSGYDGETKLVTTIASLYLLALSLKTSFQIIFQTKLVMQDWAISEVAANGLTIGLLLVLIRIGAGLPEIVLSFLVGDFLAAGVAARLGYRLLPLKLSFIRPGTKFLIWEALPMGAILVVFTIYNRVDTVILSYFKGADAVADYGLAYRIFEVVVLGGAFFANSILPIISNLAQFDRERLRVFFRKSYVVLFFLGMGAALTTFLLAPLGVRILGGSSYTGAVSALRLLSLALIVSYFNHLNGYTIIALGKQWYSLVIALVALVVNVGLNLVFIPRFSFQAAALITFITEGLIVVMSLGYIKRELGVLPSFGDIPAVVRELIQKKGKIFEELDSTD